MINRVKNTWKKFVKWFQSIDNGTKVMGVLFVLTALVGIDLLMEIIVLNMLPAHFILLAILAVVFLLAGVYFLIFGVYKNNRAKMVARCIGLALSFAVVFVGFGGITMINQLQETLSNITKNEQETESEEDVQDEVDVEELAQITKEPFILYISGNDTSQSMEHVRSDVNILAVVNPVTKQVLLVNTPRDYYVEISVAENGERDKLTHCGIYGLDCSIDTLTNLYGKEIDYYAQLNFEGFVSLIDAIGGINVYNEQEFTAFSGYCFKQGDIYLNGTLALQYVRERKSFEEGDNIRGHHQMDVISAVIDKLSSGALLANYSDILKSMNQYFACDLSQDEISSLVKMQLNDLATWNVQSYAVVGEGASKTTYSVPETPAYVMVPNEASVQHATLLMDKVLSGQTITPEDLVVPVQ